MGTLYQESDTLQSITTKHQLKFYYNKGMNASTSDHSDKKVMAYIDKE